MAETEYRKISGGYLHELQELWSDREVIRYTNIINPITPEETRRRISQLEGHDVFAIFCGGEFIGVAGCIKIAGEEAAYGLFYQICRRFWGRGYGGQAAMGVMEHMRTAHGSFTVYADVISENTASEKILKNLGFSPVSRYRRVHRGKTVEVISYRLEEAGSAD